MSEFTPLETAVLTAFAQQGASLGPLIQAQVVNATVTERENSGGGFYTTLDVPTTFAGDTPKFVDLNYAARFDGVDAELGFLLFFKEGRIDFLEGYTFYGSTAEVDLTAPRFTLRPIVWNYVSGDISELGHLCLP